MKVTGSIQNHNGTWYTYIRVTDRDGKPHQKTKSTGLKVQGKNRRETIANERKANKILDERIAEYESRATLDCDKLFLQCVEDWLLAYKSTVRQITYESYVSYYTTHIKPYFSQKHLAKLTIAEITPLHIESYIRTKRKEGQKVLSIQKHLRILNGTFDRALRFGWIDRNPVTVAEKPKVPPEERHEKKAYTPEQAQRLLAAIKGDPLEPAIMLGLFLGLRKSECLGLRWADIDFDNDIVYIRNTVVRLKTRIESEQTKSKSSRRKLYLMPQLKTYLLELQAHQKEMRMLYGNTYYENEHVCQWDDGREFSVDYPTHHFSIVLKNNNLPRITFHELRHTVGSILYNSGVGLKEVQNFLGHSDMSTTANIYTHLTPAAERATSNVLGNLLSPE